METKKNPKNPKEYYCETCDLYTSHKGDYDKHILTRKHASRHNWDKMEVSGKSTEIPKIPKIPKIPENVHIQPGKMNICKCGKEYKTSSGLWKHKNTCSFIKLATNEQKQKLFSDEMVIELIKQNKELQMCLMDQHSKIYNLIQTSTNNTNIHNTMNNNINHNTFNLHLFLNETCKNAMNLTDFVNSLDVTINDLEETGRVGFPDGITKIIVKGLKDLDITERPIHCTDIKRETIYVKEEDIWHKDDNHNKLTNAIKQVSHKNTKNIINWQKLNPEYNDPKSKQSSRFNKLLSNVMSGGTIEEQEVNVSKIVKNISREVILNKNAIISI